MNRRFGLILLALAAIFVAVLVFSKKDADAPSPTEVKLSEHVFGNAASPVRLIEYGDFECPGCYRFEPVLQQVREKYKDKIGFQFRHFPLFEIETHENALLAAKAAEAAARQNKFWEMHDVLYQNQPTWGAAPNAEKLFEAYATQLGLNIDQFKTDLKSEEVNRVIQADRAEAQRRGFSGTPAFLLNDKELTDARDDLEYFSKLIDEELAKQTSQ